MAFPTGRHRLALAAAAAGRGQQVLDHGLAAGVVQAPEVLADQFRLARVHQVLALQVVDEEIAVVAEFHLRQQRQRAFAGGVAVAGVLQRGDGAVGQADVVAQLAFLAAEPGAFHHLFFALGQLQALHVDGHGNGRQRHQQGDGGQQQDFQAQLHQGICISATSACCGASRGSGHAERAGSPPILRLRREYAAALSVVPRSAIA